MNKIASFTVNHLILEPGIYESRRDQVDQTPIVTYDLRITRPNREPVMNTAEIHTIEHLGATYLRNHPDHQDSIIYFGPMGCRTGFYLLVKGDFDPEIIYNLVQDTFDFIANFAAEIPGASARDCGNFRDQNLDMAKYYAQRYSQDLRKLADIEFKYKD